LHKRHVYQPRTTGLFMIRKQFVSRPINLPSIHPRPGPSFLFPNSLSLSLSLSACCLPYLGWLVFVSSSVKGGRQEHTERKKKRGREHITHACTTPILSAFRSIPRYSSSRTLYINDCIHRGITRKRRRRKCTHIPTYAHQYIRVLHKTILVFQF
jgi:hypothetical protein